APGTDGEQPGLPGDRLLADRGGGGRMMETRRPQRGADRPGGAGFFGRGPMAMGMPVQKAKDFRGTLRRLLGYFVPQRSRLLLVFLAAILSTVFSIVSPKIMGLAITKLFAGVVLRLKGVPGAGIDFAYI